LPKRYSNLLKTMMMNL